MENKFKYHKIYPSGAETIMPELHDIGRSECPVTDLQVIIDDIFQIESSGSFFISLERPSIGNFLSGVHVEYTRISSVE